jgi:hypothetical protein
MPDRFPNSTSSQSPALKRLASFVFTLSRARVLRGEWARVDRRIVRLARKRTPDSDAAVRDALRWYTFYSIWLACLQVVVEGYDRSHRHPGFVFSDPAIDQLLTPSRREELRRFRNTILHPEQYDHPDTATVLRQYRPFAIWAANLTDEFNRLVKDHLSTI